MRTLNVRNPSTTCLQSEKTPRLAHFLPKNGPKDEDSGCQDSDLKLYFCTHEMKMTELRTGHALMVVSCLDPRADAPIIPCRNPVSGLGWCFDRLGKCWTSTWLKHRAVTGIILVSWSASSGFIPALFPFLLAWMLNVFIPLKQKKSDIVILCEELNHLRPSARMTNTRTAWLYTLHYRLNTLSTFLLIRSRIILLNKSSPANTSIKLESRQSLNLMSYTHQESFPKACILQF